DIVQTIRYNPHLGFLYVTSAEPKSSIKFDSYNLKIATFDNINKSDYYTVSTHAVMHYYGSEVDCLPLERWEQEYQYHRKLLRIPVFALFRKWKAFRVWRTNVRYKKISKCRRSLQEHLFILNESLRPALIDIKEMCYHISDMPLCRIEKDHTYTLKEFQSAQYKQLEEVREICVCVFLYDSSQKMSYTQQANKSYHCKRLTCFIRLADYLIVNTTHMLVVNSISKLLSVFQEHITHTPSLTLIQSWAGGETSLDPDVKVKQNVNTSHQPMFITQLMLDTHSLSYQPSNDDFQVCITGRFEKTVLSLDTLLQDTYFDAFTQPIINKKVEEKTCGDGPSLEEILEDDVYLQDIILNIKVFILF
uniref:Dynein heavy chain linker domain-containing protein n=1 Tax=Sinocyclocheilus anshuiensis TaxID=1608454 RepID=A0A671M2D2_9TELE